MTEAARQVPGLAGPLWILARRQNAARGRRGRAWAMQDGNFAATLVLMPDAPPAALALRSFVAALALADTLAHVAPQAALALKWPNDVLLSGGKVAGILLESLPRPGVGPALAVGFGVNLRAAPDAGQVEPGALRPVALLQETGVAVTPEEFLQALAQAFAAWEERLVTYGFATIRAAWLARAARLGEVITARTTRETLTGTFETVDDNGHLVLKTAQGRVTIPAADVFF